MDCPNGQRLAFTYNENGLERITTPLRKCAVRYNAGADASCRSTMRSDAEHSTAMRGDYLVDVVHTDEGITHYEYGDENGQLDCTRCLLSPGVSTAHLF